MKLTKSFDQFLKQEVDLNTGRLGRLDGSVEALTNFLQNSAMFADQFLDVIPQGSYAHRTIIKPVQTSHEFDADILLHLEEVTGWEAADYVENLYACFRDNGTYKPKARKGKRCVTIDYEGDFHVDVVPYLERHGNKYITNRAEDRFELTDPEAYNAWLDEKNRTANRNLVKVIRLVKYLRNYKRTFHVKSVVLNVLLAEQVNAVELLVDPNCYADVPTTLKTVMNRLKDYVQARPNLPSIIDPSGTGEDFSNRWDQDGYAAFRTAIIRYAEWIEEAWGATEREDSLAKWQRVFGTEFQLVSSVRASQAMIKSASESAIAPIYDDTEQRLEDLNIGLSIVPKYRFRIEGKVLRKASMGAYYLKARGNKVFRGRTIKFQFAECNVPEPYSIFWKVTNRGEEAKNLNCIRGQIEAGQKVWHVEESTGFVGSHFVECYVVKNGVCVAKDRQPVIII